MARACADNLQVLRMLQRLYQLYLQLEQSAASSRSGAHIASIRNDIEETRGWLRGEVAGAEQQNLVNEYGLRPVSPERLLLMTAQIIIMEKQCSEMNNGAQ